MLAPGLGEEKILDVGEGGGGVEERRGGGADETLLVGERDESGLIDEEDVNEALSYGGDCASAVADVEADGDHLIAGDSRRRVHRRRSRKPEREWRGKTRETRELKNKYKNLLYLYGFGSGSGIASESDPIRSELKSQKLCWLFTC